MDIKKHQNNMKTVTVNCNDIDDVKRLYNFAKDRLRDLKVNPDNSLNVNIKSFDVNWNDKRSVARTRDMLKSRIGELHSNGVSKNQKIRLDLNSCENIIKTDITSVYENMQLDSAPIYYVYAHLDTNRKIAIGAGGVTTFAATLGMEYFPFYIGKGTGDRCNELNRNETHRKVRQKLTSLDKEVKVFKIKDNLTELEALCLESKLIDIFGLVVYNGLLTNLDEGVNANLRRYKYLDDYTSLRQLNEIVKIERRG